MSGPSKARALEPFKAEIHRLVCRDERNLQESCERVARLAPNVAAGLRDSPAVLDAPTGTYADWLETAPL